MFDFLDKDNRQKNKDFRTKILEQRTKTKDQS